MQVIGLCRFSFPALGSFQIEHETLEDRRRYLYSPERLEERFRLFETSTLPCFREHTDEDFLLLVAVGECLPKAAFDRLKDLTAGIKQVRIVQKSAESGEKHRQIMKGILNTARDDLDQPCLQFRHDDDDAVSVDFVERLREATEDSKALMSRNRTVGIDFNKGFVARLNADGIKAAEAFKSLIGVGLGMYVAGGCKHTIFSFAHHRIGRFMPVVSYPDAPMWVRSLHASNDSWGARNNTEDLSPLSPEQEGEFIARFAIDQNLVRQVHSAGCT
ncbi:putative rhamnosyl transferase [Ruegeria sp. ANG10]|uniref:putative rhamnosyl transferase n=1 Tax=Ruegeria sp. ANG10 TaxID=3042467 RepID=UPI003452449F